MKSLNSNFLLDSNVDIKRINALFKAAIFSYIFGIFIVTVYYAWTNVVSNNPWKIGDWLINYQGGFVRRGLTGELFFLLSSLTEIRPSIYAFITQIACYFFYFFFSGLLLTREQKLLPYILLLISPFIFLFQIHDVQGGYRKEIIYFAILAFTVWSAVYFETKKFEFVTISILVIYPLVILTHEMFAIFLPYILVVYFSRVVVTTKRLIVTSILVIPSIITFLLSLRNSGTAEQVLAICSSLGDYAPKNCGTRGAIGWLDNSAHSGMQRVLKYITSGHYLEYYSFATILSFVAYFPIINKLNLILKSRLSLFLIATSVVGSSALFIVAVDWGRFIYIHLVSFFIISLLISNEKLKLDGGIAHKLSNFYVGCKIKKNTFYVMLFLLIIGYSSLWHIPHCCGKPPFISNMTTSKVGLLLRVLD